MWFTLRQLALGLWVGAMTAFAFLFAPAALAHIGPTAAFAATIAACIRAMTTTGAWLGIVAAVITIAARLEAPRRRSAIVASIAVAMAASFVEVSFVLPQMEATPLLTPAYDALHRSSSGVYSVTLLAAFAAFAMSGLPYRSR